ncbi:copper resistance CopC family protein [Georgenia subflava]|nr:copper resistance CopC family protein [Georgenia subflava]
MSATAFPRLVAARTRPAAARAARLPLSTMLGLLMLLGVAALVTAPSARAHDTLIEASPAQDAVVEAAPTAVALTFSAEILDLPTTIIVTAADGAVVAEGTPQLDGQAVRLALPPDLPNSDYDVTWSVVSSDGHRTEDSYTFTLAGADDAAPSQSATPSTPTAAPQPSQAPEAGPAPDADAGTTAQEDGPAWMPSWTTILLVQAGIIVLAVAAALAYKRRRTGR